VKPAGHEPATGVVQPVLTSVQSGQTDLAAGCIVTRVMTKARVHSHARYIAE
jgi:hypothetical protein